MSQHTPGPWYYDEKTETIRTNCDSDRVGQLCSDSEHHANMKLQAASPEMLEALKRILPYCMELRDDEPTPLYEHYHASKSVHMAIAKAEGRS